MIQSDIVVQCEEIMKKHSASFYAAFKSLPSPRKEAVFIIYAFCRMIDDSVDEPESSPYTLDELEDLFVDLDHAEGHFIWPCLRWLFSTFPIEKGPFFKQMAGQKMDLSLTVYQSIDQLEIYCERVAGSVGEMLLPVLHDHPTSEVKEAGIYLGKAMQIVNIIRDVGEDLERGRRYIPTEWMDQYLYTQSDFEEKAVNFHFKRLMNGLMGLAHNWFEMGLANLDSYPPQSAFSIKLAAGYYAAIMEAIKINDYQVFEKRAVVTDKKKKAIYVSALQDALGNEARSIEA